MVYVSNGYVEFACYAAAPSTYGTKKTVVTMTVEKCTAFCAASSGFQKYAQIEDGKT